MSDPKPYNPLDRVELGKSVERALLESPLGPLPPAESFPGAGLYAIYYAGDLDIYEEIALGKRGRDEIPIYVGRASAPGARQGALGLEGTTTKPVLYTRLNEHAKSIAAAEKFGSELDVPSLRVEDFRCRYLVADDIWVPMAEALLIGHYRPVWNVLVDGFGNHDPGGGRRNQARSSWDELHPGRSWAATLADAKKSAAELREEVLAHLAQVTTPDLSRLPSIDQEVEQALEEEQVQEATDTLFG